MDAHRGNHKHPKQTWPWGWISWYSHACASGPTSYLAKSGAVAGCTRPQTKIMNRSMVPPVGWVLTINVDSPSCHHWRSGQDESKILVPSPIQETQQNMLSRYHVASFCTSEYKMHAFPTKSRSWWNESKDATGWDWCAFPKIHSKQILRGKNWCRIYTILLYESR